MPKAHCFRFPSLMKLFIALFLLSNLAFGQTTKVRIMPLGDSITGSPGCWRALLWDHLQKTGITNIDFVGTQPPQGCSVPYDGDNEGHGGALATMVADQNQLPAWLAATRPDIVLMHFGTNDIWSGRTTPVILAAFSKLVDQMRASNPNMIILVAQIIPVNPSTCADCAQRTIAFNAAIPAWAASKNTAESPIIVVDQWTGFNSATDTSEGVHPNDLGFQKMADKWFPVLSALLAGQPPAPGFSLSTNPAAVSITAGTSGTATINLARFAGFTAPVSLIPPPIAAGIGLSFSANPVTGDSSILTISVASNVAPGVRAIPIIGSAGGLSSSTTVNVTITAPLTPFFTIFAGRANQTIDRGTSITNTITINRINNFAGPVDLSIAALPAGVTASFSPNPATGTTSTLTFTAAPTATVGTNQVLVIGTGTPGTFNTTVNLSVSDPTVSPCGTPISVPLPFSRDGAGDFCFAISGTINFVNSFNTQLIEINGVPFTNKWANMLPPRINGNYYVHYVANLPFAHFEANGVSDSANFILTSPASFSFFASGGSGPVLVSSNTSWTVTTDQPWLTVSPTSGVNNGTFTITAPANLSATARVGNATLSGGGITRTVAVTQSGASTTNQLFVAPASLSLAATFGSAAVNITSNTTWAATTDQPWVTISPASGSNNGSTLVSAMDNPTNASRNATVTFVGGGLTRTVSVTQAGLVPPTPCPNPITITLPFVKNGEGEFCWVTSGNISFINSWNIQLLEINGVPFTGKWADKFPPRINGNYYIHYIGTVPFAHFEANGTP